MPPLTVGHAFQERRTLAGPGPGRGRLHRIIHGEDIVSVQPHPGKAVPLGATGEV